MPFFRHIHHSTYFTIFLHHPWKNYHFVLFIHFLNAFEIKKILYYYYDIKDFCIFQFYFNFTHFLFQIQEVQILKSFIQFRKTLKIFF